MKRLSILFPAVMLAVGVIYEVMALQMPRGSMARPGPGFFPMVVGVFLIATALGCLFQDILKHKAAARRPEGRSAADRVVPTDSDVNKTVQLVALMVGYILALAPLGFPAAIFIFLVISTRIFGSRKWPVVVLTAAVITALAHLCFVVWLSVPLPLGILEEVLG